ncbi:hypothetical protein Aglo01_66220 [Actinokineospora globicatena]|uniref:Uncharacterized protein n=1 Tax=Actinokineospora globicatena TaxID=103729 RepID=A0A9W6VD64_9PSEU|nr:hypothetical protein Aglo01_66220 [Actinokineospora globicatena]GLW94926.1 hypothetical protein Aglo03_57420 [Actinokineospora globicatena]
MMNTEDAGEIAESVMSRVPSTFSPRRSAGVGGGEFGVDGGSGDDGDGSGMAVSSDAVL